MYNKREKRYNKVHNQIQYSFAYNCFGFLCLLIFLFFEGFLLYFLHVSLTSVDAIPVGKIQVEGELDYISANDIEQFLLKNPESGNIFTMNFTEMRQYLEDLPWIYQTSLRKKAPNILVVSIVENKPIAYFNNGILTNHWKVVYPNLEIVKAKLVHLYGKEEFAQQMYDRYIEFNNYLLESGMHILSLTFTDNFVWKLRLNNGIELILGKDVDNVFLGKNKKNILLSRLKKFVLTYPYIENKQNIDYVDLRYNTGFSLKEKQSGL
ncbi:MAG: cell division protein FtsQ/DivIB [Succinivibrionaceae bacterium]